MESLNWIFLVAIMIATVSASIKFALWLIDIFHIKPVLSVFKERQGSWLDVSQVSEQTKLPEEVVVRILRTLSEAGMLDYKISPMVVEQKVRQIRPQYEDVSVTELEKIATNEAGAEQNSLVKDGDFEPDVLVYRLNHDVEL